MCSLAIIMLLALLFSSSNRCDWGATFHPRNQVAVNFFARNMLNLDGAILTSVHGRGKRYRVFTMVTLHFLGAPGGLSLRYLTPGDVDLNSDVHVTSLIGHDREVRANREVYGV